MRRVRLQPFAVSTAIAAVALLAPVDVSSQDRPIDRWLVAETDETEGYPLAGERDRIFPDRDLDLGPGYWNLVREDGATEIGLARGGTALAHVYIRAFEDVTVGLSLSVPDCSSIEAWVNGQLLGSVDPVAVRLAGGWNTLLLQVTETGADCPLSVSAALQSAPGPLRKDEDPADLSELIVQASRPPGARPNYPGGVALVERPEPVGVVWDGANGNLLVEMATYFTTWGRPPGVPSNSGALDRPAGPPTVDLTGEWDLTLYTPNGILEGRAALEMAEGGELTGRIEGDRIEGNIRDGWVAEDEFGWIIRIDGPRRDFNLQVRGVLSDDELMSGSLEFGNFRDFEARFEGERASEEDDEAEAKDEPRPEEDAEGDAAEDERPPAGRGPPSDPRADMPMIPAPGDPDPVEDRDELEAPPDPDGLRARIVGALLPPPERPPEAAPEELSAELDIGGGDVAGGLSELEPLAANAIAGTVRFANARSAALDETGFEARVRWHDDDYDFAGSISAAELLVAFHGSIRLTGWGLEGSGGFAGSFRIPRELDGFTLVTGAGDWTVDGAVVADSVLCDPCERGRTLDLRVVGTEQPEVRVADPGYPDSQGSSAREWLEALQGDNARYREKVGGSNQTDSRSLPVGLLRVP